MCFTMHLLQNSNHSAGLQGNRSRSEKSLVAKVFHYKGKAQPIKSHFPSASFTSALEPGVREETERYLAIIILLAGFKRYRSWRVPIAIYGNSSIGQYFLLTPSLFYHTSSTP